MYVYLQQECHFWKNQSGCGWRGRRRPGWAALRSQRFDVDAVFLQLPVQRAAAEAEFARYFPDVALVQGHGGANEVFLRLGRGGDHRRLRGLNEKPRRLLRQKAQLKRSS